ncbi:MAG: hypothetical protein V3S69_00200 [Dehalococcoidales bacterium]
MGTTDKTLFKPTLDINGDDVWIQTYKEGLNPPSNICVDEIYRTDKQKIIDLFFKSDPKVYEKELKKSDKQQKLDQEQMDNIVSFLFERTEHDLEGLIKWHTEMLDKHNRHLRDLRKKRNDKA